MITYESEYWNKNEMVCGIDEVGRGCMAGPLVVCSVILPIGYNNVLIDDSKKISEKKRSELFDLIVEVSHSIDVEIVNEVTIDSMNIYAATKMAMEQLIERSEANNALVDAMPTNTSKTVKSIIKGDANSISIAAASIVAKVIRDEIMQYLDAGIPGYGFSKHKGYVTKLHKEKLHELGVTKIHRKSYKPVQEVLAIQIINKL